MSIKIYNLKDLPSQQDIIVDTFNTAGGWGYNMVGVRITHAPSGIVVECDEERSAHKNKILAMEALKNALLNKTLKPGDENG